ncbi:hypothetical protein [Devosia submarina]|uniref:hypothetical protein n=1 Tax=Devosia submarina TaxID=1173082 RepID=UPI000D381568|nr:hypothetical protein [Devosia submarina]
MSWFNKPLKLLLVAGIIGSAAALSGCSFSPVYSSAAVSQGTLALAYAKPNSRLEQIVYQELSLRLGPTDSEAAPLASVSISPAIREMTLSRTDNPNRAMEAAVTATLTVTPRDGSGGAVQTYTRRATAQYTRNDQVLAERSAQEEALERAAKAAAESLRVAVLASASR